jgi:hypothetical protein
MFRMVEPQSDPTMKDLFIIQSIFRRYIVELKLFLNQYLQGRKESREMGIVILRELEAAMVLLDPLEPDVVAENKRQVEEGKITVEQQDAKHRLDQINAIRDVLEAFDVAIEERTKSDVSKRVKKHAKENHIKESQQVLEPEVSEDKEREEIKALREFEKLQLEKKSLFSARPIEHLKQTEGIIQQLQDVTQAPRAESYYDAKAAFLKKLHYLGNKLGDKGLVKPSAIKIELAAQMNEEKSAQQDEDIVEMTPEEKQAHAAALERQVIQARLLTTHTRLTFFLKRMTIKEILHKFTTPSKSTILGKSSTSSDSELINMHLDSLIEHLPYENLPPMSASKYVAPTPGRLF